MVVHTKIKAFSVEIRGSKYAYLNTNLSDALVCFRVAGRLERRVSHQTLVTQHTDAPQIHLLIVSVTLDHLRRKIVQRATHGAASETRSEIMRFTTNIYTFLNQDAST